MKFHTKKSMGTYVYLGHTCLSPPGVELGTSKDGYASNILLYWNGEVNAL